jgi:hypothetical protein
METVMKNEQDVRDLDALVKRAIQNRPGGSRVFRPFAVFDESLDCIRVVTRDCSAGEVRINERITLLEDNHWAPPRGKYYVGFTIKGAKHFCHEQGFDLKTPIRLAEILDRIVATFPDLAVRVAVKAVARPIVDDVPELERIDLSGSRHGGLVSATA